MFDPDDDIRDGLAAFSPKARDTLRRVLIRDQADRDAVTSRPLTLPRGREATTGPTSSTMLTMHPEVRRRVVRLLGEIEARG
jgi:hypothetical protein